MDDETLGPPRRGEGELSTSKLYYGHKLKMNHAYPPAVRQGEGKKSRALMKRKSSELILAQAYKYPRYAAETLC